MAKKSAGATSVKIPHDLFSSLQTLIEGTGFHTVDDFVVYVLRDVAAGGKLKERPTGIPDHDIDVVHKRLQSLGYID